MVAGGGVGKFLDSLVKETKVGKNRSGGNSVMEQRLCVAGPADVIHINKSG